MRLIRSKIYRAFPELDRFSDEQCRRFVTAANASWRRRIGRWLVVGFSTLAMLLACIVGVVMAAEVVDKRLNVGDVAGVLVGIVMFSVATGLPLVGGLVLRDRILRMRVRQLIRRCGACPRCHYSLLGIRVGVDHVIVCPECATQVVADPAMGELTTDETGVSVYKPEVAREDVLARERRRRRHRAFLKYAALGTGAAAVLLAMAMGGWWMFLKAQARRALAERDTAQRIHALQVEMWGARAHDGSDAEFETYRNLIAKAAAFTRLPLEPDETPKFGVAFDAATLRDGADVAAFEKHAGAGAFADNRAYTQKRLDRAIADGLPAKLRGILDLRAPIRTMVPPPGEAFVMVQVLDLTDARAMARLNRARMIEAFRRGDRTDYLEAMEESLVAAQIVDRQGLLIDRLVATAIRAMVFDEAMQDALDMPDAAWLEGTIGVIGRRGGRVSFAVSLEVERVAGLDAIQWMFGDPGKVARAQLGLGNSLGVAAGWGPWGASLGTYDQNKQAWNAVYGAYEKAAACTDPGARPAVPGTPTGLVMIDTLTPALGRIFQTEDRDLYESRRCTTMLAAALYLKREGRSPQNSDDLKGLVPETTALIDPLSGKPFRVEVKQNPGKDGRPFDIRDGERESEKTAAPKSGNPSGGK